MKFIGSYVDMREFAPTQQLTSNCWTWGPWMAKQVEAVREGNFKGAWCELDINDGAISLADYSDAVPQNVIDMIEERGSLCRPAVRQHRKAAGARGRVPDRRGGQQLAVVPAQRYRQLGG